MNEVARLIDLARQAPPTLPALGKWVIGWRVLVKHPERPFDGYTGRVHSMDSFTDDDGESFETVTVRFDEPEPVVWQHGVEMPILNVTVAYAPYRIELLYD